MEDCVFCQIVEGKLPSEMVYQDEDIAVFPSIDPKAPVHLLLIPKKHVEHLNDLPDEVLIKIKNKAMEIVTEKELASKGYRVITNGGAAKMVQHLHIHLLGDVSAHREV